MNCLTEKINMLLRPEAALIVYHCEEPEKMFYLETRPITPDGKMGAAQPVSCEFMNRLTSAYCESHSGTPFGPIPETMLYCDVRKGREKYIWYNPPAKRMMYFRKDLCMENAEYHMPGVIYIATNETLRIFAYKGKRPAKNAELFFAPFFNTSSNNVCLGTARLDKPCNPTYDELTDYWEKRFWQSEFSHLSSEGNPTEHNLVLVTKAAKEQPFDPNELKPYRKTLNQLFK